jgi:hypothetical protein
MTKLSMLVFDSFGPNGNTGVWINTGNLDPNFSLHVFGLESGGSLQVFGANYPYTATPLTPDQTDPNSALILTLASTGTPSITPINMSVGWIQIVKIPGTTPTETFVRLAGRQL